MRSSHSSTAAFALLLVLAAGLTSCDLFRIEDQSDPNGLSIDALDDPSRAEIGNLATGVEAGMREEIDQYLWDVGMFGREVYRFSSSEPRFTADLLGKTTAVLDNNTFYLTRPWDARYRVVRNAELLLEAVERVDDPVVLSDAEKSATRGFAKTIVAYQLLLNLNLTYQNGIRVDVSAEDEELGPFVGYDEALSAIATLLDEAASDLDGGGEAFPFALSAGLSGFDAPATFTTVNRALAARVAAYQEDFARTLSLLEDSFLDTSGDLTRGAYHVFSTDPIGKTNPVFINPQGTGEVMAAHPSYVADIDPDDARIAKVVARNETFARDDLTSDWGFFVYTSQTAPIPIVRNAELVLLRAEARLQTDDLEGAEQDLNVIRSAAGLDDYGGPTSREALLAEMLRQRRFELYGEGHRWIDVRRYRDADCDASAIDGGGCLNDDLPIDREGDDVWLQFPIPATENVGS